eukprot:c48121_g1_i1 orf=423-848(+)
MWGCSHHLELIASSIRKHEASFSLFGATRQHKAIPAVFSANSSLRETTLYHVELRQSTKLFSYYVGCFLSCGTKSSFSKTIQSYFLLRGTKTALGREHESSSLLHGAISHHRKAETALGKQHGVSFGYVRLFLSQFLLHDV